MVDADDKGLAQNLLQMERDMEAEDPRELTHRWIHALEEMEDYANADQKAAIQLLLNPIQTYLDLSRD